MVRRSFTAVLEKNATFTASFQTEPYETAWAGEARWFVRVQEIAGAGTKMRATAQVSPDGLFWCDEGTPGFEMSGPGMYSQALREFGGWLRLNVELSGEGPRVKLTIYLALKE
jgi:hypothetical protein